MPQSLARVIVHIIFSTKNREPFIEEHLEESLFAFLAHQCQELDCVPIQIGGYMDHVHLVIGLSRKISIMNLLQVVKQESSKWMKTNGEPFIDFYWQNGYSIFSVDPYRLDNLKAYVRNQRLHHSANTYQEECRTLWREYGIDWDERYVWD